MTDSERLLLAALEICQPVNMAAVRRQAAEMKRALMRHYGAKKCQETPMNPRIRPQIGANDQSSTVKEYDVARADDAE